MTTRRPRLRQRAHHEAGLTLIETLVAFAIMAGVVSSILALLSQNARYLASAEDRFLAGVLVNNLMVEEMADAQTPESGSTEDETTFAGRQFIFVRTGLEVGQGVFQVTYEVRRADIGQTLARVSALKGTGQ
ncbi:MAG: type II secretion system protein GspI [Alphaproteobacteria bacterium]|nr:type II secretion system protein GspI [Alphaproteobacteria bacterium]